MRVVLQKVKKAEVSVDGTLISAIDRGLLLLVGVEENDEREDLIYCANKIAKMRIFEDEDDKMNLSISDCNGRVLSVSQFTLMADTKKGNRPSFTRAARPDKALSYFKQFNTLLEERLHFPVKTGLFGAHMQVKLVNDGPVTIIVDSHNK